MLTRRQFAGASLAAWSPAAPAAPRGANDRIRVAVVGCRGRGWDLMKCVHELAASENLELAALCDADENVLGDRLGKFNSLSGGARVRTCTDIRVLLEDQSIDAVMHATPTHWHVLGALWSLQAGKDAFVEKPLSHNIWEGRKLVEAARKYDRIVQHGTQCRSSPGILEGVRQLRSGVIGEVYMARGITYKYRGSVGRTQEEPVPKGVHYDLWVGPAPMKPFSRHRFHYNWHWQWDYGAGDAGNQGVHQLDLIRLGLDLPGHPTKVQAMGGKFVHKDDRETPNVHAAAFQWEGRNILVEFEVRSLYSNYEAGMGDTFPFQRGKQGDSCGVVFYGSEGFMVMPDYLSYHTYLGPGHKPGPSGDCAKTECAGDLWANKPHIRNFFAAVRSRKRSSLNAEVEEGHLSASLSHLANIAYRVGRTLRFDPQTERFAGDEEANALLSRAYRSPYVVPNTV